ncbi:NADH-quinone oxidoreductase subunit NuoE family protein [Kordiimonas aestuarii]|uniref:NADH-quinone oxidoreductase subunit NuoE family protein n=1 Tax=Kordiimonas aestuarii TaxID=1005925 RepID=UPI0021D2D088|nr:NAD(P)H-dependent oxidoreductase subunit E [Kordiimonas aestuarii]
MTPGSRVREGLEVTDAKAQNVGAMDALIAKYVGVQGGLMRALLALQEADGYIDASALPKLAAAFNLTKAEVKGVISFYDDFARAPKGEHVLRLCQAEACQAVGARELTQHACERADVAMGDTRMDGRITIEPVYCLGLCANGPAAMVDGKLKAAVGEADIDALLDAWEHEA